MDETGLQYRCHPSQTYIAAGRRRHVRGSKAMKAKDRETLVLNCHATGSHKIPVAIIGCADVRQCFKPPRYGCPLPYSSQEARHGKRFRRRVARRGGRIRRPLGRAVRLAHCRRVARRGGRIRRECAWPCFVCPTPAPSCFVVKAVPITTVRRICGLWAALLSPPTPTPSFQMRYGLMWRAPSTVARASPAADPRLPGGA